MKKTLLTSVLSLAVAVSAMAQGQVDFRNSSLTSPSGRFVFDADGTTKLATAAFSAQLYYSLTGVGGAFIPVTDPAVPFRNVGAGDGFWNPGVSNFRNITGTVGGQTVALEVRAWSTASGATYDAAALVGGAHVGISTPFTYVLGGDPGNGQPATLPGPMTGFNSFSLTIVPVPEPSTIALGVMGLGSLLFVRRRK